MTAASNATDLAAKFHQATAELKIRDVSRAKVHKQFANAAAPLGISVYLGTIANVGRHSGGGSQVQFDDAACNTGYVSQWPQWAFGLAAAALLDSSEVLLIANGDPFGFNLVDVLVLA